MGDNIRNLVWSDGLGGDLAELEFGFLLVNWMGLISSFHVIEHSEVLSSLVEGDDVHESAREGAVSSDSVVNLNEAGLVLHDFLDLSSVQSVSESVLQKNAQRKAFSQLVRSSGRSWGLERIRIMRAKEVGKSGGKLT